MEPEAELEGAPVAPACEPIWCVVGNIVLERPYGPGGAETRSGTRKFRPGAKVVCALFRWRSDLTNVQVVGRHRATNRYITCYVWAGWLTNLRVELVRSPAIVKRINQCCGDGATDSGFDGNEEMRLRAETYIEWLAIHFGTTDQPQITTRTTGSPPDRGPADSSDPVSGTE